MASEDPLERPGDDDAWTTVLALSDDRRPRVEVSPVAVATLAHPQPRLGHSAPRQGAVSRAPPSRAA